MLGLVLIWRLRFRHLGGWMPFLVALNAVLIIEPLASLMPGFWLSFTAVAVLMFTFGGRLGPWGWRVAWTRPHILIALGLFPMLWILRLARQPERSAGQSGGCAVDQPAGAADSPFRHIAVAGALAWRNPVMGFRRLA